MKPIKILICLFVLLNSLQSIAQNNYRNGIGLNYSIGFSGALNGMKILASAAGPPIVTESITPIRAYKISGSVFRYLSKTIGMKISIGRSTNGFDFTGSVATSLIVDKAYYKAKTMEYGFSLLGKIPAFNYGNVLIEPGIRLYSDVSPESSLINPGQKNAFVFSGYIGYEIPMLANNFFSTIGILINIPIDQHSYFIDSALSYYPYFIGLRLGANLQY